MSKYDNSGALFRNDRKEKENHPDHTGKATIDGKEYWLSAWVKEKDGVRYFSLAFKPKEESGQQAKAAPQSRGRSDIDDDIPFLPER